MRISFTLFFYIMRQFLVTVGIVLLTFLILIMLLDALELVRRSHNKDIPLFVLLQMVLLKFPLMGQKIMPFVMLISSVLTYTKLSRTQELVVIRSAGISVWEFLFPTVFSAFTLGILMIAIINPLACIMISRYERLEAKYFQGRDSFLAVSSSGLWLRQRNYSFISNRDIGETIIHAEKVGTEEDTIDLEDLIIFMYNSSNKFSKRIDAKEAKLLTDFWHLKDVIVTSPDGTTRKENEYFMETELTVRDIQDSFASPETISFWSLPGFINTLKKSGFSALPHRLHWHGILASPLFYSSMIFIAALFSLRPSRQGGTGLLISSSILVGFLIYFLSNLVSSLGLSGSIPIVLAAWTPVSVSLLIGIGFLLHFEDG